MLARDGHAATVVERDRREPPPDVETAAAGVLRATAPQILQPHVLLATFRELLHERPPDVHRALLDAGVTEAPLDTQIPPTLAARLRRATNGCGP